MNNTQTKDATRILDTALDLAQKRGDWGDLGFKELAARCEMSVNEVRRFYDDTNAIANAWFERALGAMLSNEYDLADLPVSKRLELIIQRWFDSLAPYHPVTAQMLQTKLHAPHVHHWVPMVFDLSRLIQFWRDAAALNAGGRRRQIEEIVLTGIFLATLRDWCRDSTPDQSEARTRLRKRLSRAEKAAGLWFSWTPRRL